MFIGNYQILPGDIINLITYEGQICNGTVLDVYHWATSHDDAIAIQIQTNTGIYDFDDREIKWIEYLGTNQDYE